MGQLCELCLRRDAAREIERYGICAECEDENPRLIRGLEYELGGIPDRYRKGEQTHWYTYAGIRSTRAIRHADPPDKLDSYSADFRIATAQLGVKRTLTHLLLHHYIGDVVFRDRGHSNGEVGLPPRMIQYGLSLAGTVPPVSPKEHKTTVERGAISRICNASAQELSKQQVRPEFNESHRVIANLEAIYARVVDEVDRSDPQSSEYKALNAAQGLNLGESGFAYPKQYLEAMERWYTPFQHLFLDQMGLNMVKAVSWARDILDLFNKRYVAVLQEIRRYQTDALRLIGDLAEPILGTEAESFETDLPREELKRAEQLSWATLVPLVENRLWLSRQELVANIAPANPSKFLTFIDRISKSAGMFSKTEPGGFIETEKYPLIQVENCLLVPDQRHFTRSLANTFFHDLKEMGVRIDIGDKKADMGNIRGDITEDWIGDYVLRAFGDEHTYLNIKRNEGDHEIDALAIVDETALVFEVKTKRLTKQALSGDFEKINSDIKQGLNAAASQLETRIERLQDGMFQEEIPELRQVSEYLPVVAIGTTYGSFGTTAYPELLDEEMVPYIVSTYDLDVISRVLSAKEIIEYIQDRISQNKAGQLRSMDEMDYLGMYLHGPWIGSGGMMTEHFEEASEQAGMELIAPISGADKFVDDEVPELTHSFHLPFFTPKEQLDLWQ